MTSIRDCAGMALLLQACAASTVSSTPTTTTAPSTSTPSLQVKLSEERAPPPEYASYFERIKQAVTDAWDVKTELRRRDPLGDQYLYKDRLTCLLVTLDADGALTNAHVGSTSGVDFLDHAAIEAFQKAQPFMNPPKGLVDASGEIKFTFSFYLEPPHHSRSHFHLPLSCDWSPTTTTAPATSMPSLQVKLSEELPLEYASYFKRIRQAVSGAWDVKTELAHRDPLGERFLYKDRVTWLGVTLGADGALIDVEVTRTSGVEFLDRAAIEAFRKAQPFGSPPSGLADASGKIKFTFGFHLEKVNKGRPSLDPSR